MTIGEENGRGCPAQQGLPAALAVSLTAHIALFGVVSGIATQKRATAIPSIQVEVVQLPPAPKARLLASPAAGPGKPVPLGKATLPEPLLQKSPPWLETKVAPPSTEAPTGPMADKAPPSPSPSPAPGGALRQLPLAGSTTHPLPLEPVGTAPAGPERGTRPPSGGSTPAGATKPGKKGYHPLHRLSVHPGFKKRITPAYPRSERSAGVEAAVLAEVYLDETGTVEKVTIRKSGGIPFDQAVVEAIKGSTFSPGYAGAQAVPTVLQIPFVFKLH